MVERAPLLNGQAPDRPMIRRRPRLTEVGATTTDETELNELRTADSRPVWSDSEPIQRSEVEFCRQVNGELEHLTKEEASECLLRLVEQIYQYRVVAAADNEDVSERSRARRAVVQAGKDFHHALLRFYAAITPHRERGNREVVAQLSLNANSIRRLVKQELAKLTDVISEFEIESISKEVLNNCSGTAAELIAADTLDQAGVAIDDDVAVYEPIDIKNERVRIDEDGQGVDLWLKLADGQNALALGIQVKSVPMYPGRLAEHLFIFSCEADIQAVLDRVLDVNVLSPGAYARVAEYRDRLTRSMRKLLTIQGGDSKIGSGRNEIPALMIIPSSDFPEALDERREPAYQPGTLVPTTSFVRGVTASLHRLTDPQEQERLLTRSLLYANNHLGPLYGIERGEPIVQPTRK